MGKKAKKVKSAKGKKGAKKETELRNLKPTSDPQGGNLAPRAIGSRSLGFAVPDWATGGGDAPPPGTEVKCETTSGDGTKWDYGRD